MIMHFLIALCALLLDRVVGDPDRLWRHVPHPIVWFGRLIGLMDHALNREEASFVRRKMAGCITLIIVLGIAIAVGLMLNWLFLTLGLWGVGLEVIIVAIFLAQKSLFSHVHQVAVGFQQNGLEGARLAVSMIVGRDMEQADAHAIVSASLESLAENMSDGVIAPLFWYLLAGLPGLLAYKMLNTADSMIGHKNARFAAFGWASARLDDVANFIPARLSAVLIIVHNAVIWGSQQARHVGAIIWRDAPQHRSPNAGWPEAGFAATLDVALSGPRSYDGEWVNEPYQNGAGHKADWVDLNAGLNLFSMLMNWLIAVVGGLALIFMLLF